jgi:hypothetical protein
VPKFFRGVGVELKNSRLVKVGGNGDFEYLSGLETRPTELIRISASPEKRNYNVKNFNLGMFRFKDYKTFTLKSSGGDIE